MPRSCSLERVVFSRGSWCDPDSHIDRRVFLRVGGAVRIRIARRRSSHVLPRAPTGGSPFCTSNPNLAHPNSRRFQPKDVLGEDQEYLHEVVPLQLQLQRPGRVWQDEGPREPEGRAVRARKQLDLLTVVAAEDGQEAAKAR